MGTAVRKTPRRLRLSSGAWRRLAKQIDSHSAFLDWRTRLSYFLAGTGNSLLARIQHASHAEQIKAAVPAPPLFLLGFWRSGTTFLHELFCSDTRFGFPSTYACMNPSHFLLTEKWANMRAPQQALRPMDSMQYSWASPQEDEFALLALGAPSVYEALIVPSLMRDAQSLVDIRRRSPEELARWVEVLQFFVRLLTVQQGKAMILKSPPHGFRLPLLPSLFPLARYVVLERNPYEVFASNVKLWRTMLEMYGVVSVSSDEIEQFILAAYALHEEAIAEGVGNIDPRRIAKVRYEELIADPVGEMVRLYRELNLEDFEVARPRVERYLASVSNHTRNRFRLTPTQKEAVDCGWGRLILEKGYGWPDDYVSLG